MYGNATLETTLQRKQAVIYCRVSTDKQEQDGESLEYQDAKCRQYAELHDIDVVVVVHEAKSGFIHYSLREKLTLARQFIRDKLANMIIVWDLRRFSRNFVHSAMIFEEIESCGGEVISVSENIDNTLTGKLVRSILAWSAESERNKIVEYANRRWQTRVELGLPVGTGRSSYGWDWKDKEKTAYVINPEEAAVRVSIFHMFVELDMSLRAIAHKLAEDRVPTPTYARRLREQPPPDGEVPLECCLWRYSTIRELLMDLENIGILVVCKEKQIVMPDGRRHHEPHPNRREVPGGIPAIISPALYHRAQAKLQTHKVQQSRRPLREEDFLLRGHIFCACCGCSMKARTQQRDRRTKTGADKLYPFYLCTNIQNKYAACATRTSIRTAPLDDIVWQECCRLFRRMDAMRVVLETELAAAVNSLLEATTGQNQVNDIEATIALANAERAKYPAGSYMHNLISQDIAKQEEQLARYKAELGSRDIAAATAAYSARVQGFLEFLDEMQHSYHEATFQKKRNAIDILGVRVTVSDTVEAHGISADAVTLADRQEWFTAREAARVLGVERKTIYFYWRNGTITNYREDPHLLIHREEVVKLQERGFLQRNTEGIVRSRIRITYSPKLDSATLREMSTADQVSLQTRR